MVLRSMKSADYPALVDLLSELGYPTNETALRERIKLFGKKSDLVLVAVEKKKVTGFISLHLMPMIHGDGQLCRVTALVVGKKFRRHGIGKTLLRQAEFRAKARGAVKCEVTSNERRKPAHAFYAARGYQEYRKRFLKRL